MSDLRTALCACLIVLTATYCAATSACQPQSSAESQHSVSDAQNTPQPAAITDDLRNPLKTGWKWLRENPDGWRVTETGLQVLIEPGNLWGPANDARNVLLRQIPRPWHHGVDARIQIEHAPERRWEQANMVWYLNDSAMVKLGLEAEHGRRNIVMGREEADRTRTIAIIPTESSAVQLRLVVVDQTIRGYFRRPDATEWTAAGECPIPVMSDDSTPHVSLQCYQGEQGSNRWATFSRFEMKPAEITAISRDK